MRLAIVGSVRFVDPDAFDIAEDLIRRTLARHEPEVVISGGADGIDTLAETIAIAEHVPTSIHLPEHPRWQPRGYKDRNILVAEDCTHLLAIRCHASRTYGSGWTADYAERIGREVHRRII